MNQVTGLGFRGTLSRSAVNHLDWHWWECTRTPLWGFAPWLGGVLALYAHRQRGWDSNLPNLFNFGFGLSRCEHWLLSANFGTLYPHSVFLQGITYDSLKTLFLKPKPSWLHLIFFSPFFFSPHLWVAPSGQQKMTFSPIRIQQSTTHPANSNFDHP